MDKLTNIILAVIGLLYLLPMISVGQLESLNGWVFSLGLLVIGVKGLMDK